MAHAGSARVEEVLVVVYKIKDVWSLWYAVSLATTTWRLGDVVNRPRLGVYGAWRRGFMGLLGGNTKSTEQPATSCVSSCCRVSIRSPYVKLADF